MKDTLMKAPSTKLTGRPKNSRNVADVIKLARRQTRAAIQTLTRIMKDDDQNSFARIQAAQALLTRGWGQPKGRIDTVHHLSDVELELTARAILERRIKKKPDEIVEATVEFVEIFDDEPVSTH